MCVHACRGESYSTVYSAVFPMHSPQMFWHFLFSRGVHDVGDRLCMYTFMHLSLPSCTVTSFIRP